MRSAAFVDRCRTGLYRAFPVWGVSRWPWLLLALAVVVVLAFTSGSFSATASDPAGGGYYLRLADAFLHGRASLTQLPPDWLLNAPNPYDPAVSGGVRSYGIHDSILFDGKYWYYWGPGAVAFFVTPLAAIGISLDETTFGMIALIVIAWCGIDVAALLKHIGRIGPAVAGALAVALALTFSAMFTTSRIGIWEGNILVAAALSGVALQLFLRVWLGVARRPMALIVVGSLLAMIAITVRVEAFAVLMVPVAMVLLGRLRPSLAPRLRWRAAVPPMLGGLLGVALLLGYNAARFGDPLDFMVNQQMTGADQSRLVFNQTSYIVPNLYHYLIRPAPIESVHPYLDFGAFPWTRPVAGTYSVPEPVAGLAWTTPWIAGVVVLLVVLGVGLLIRRIRPSDIDMRLLTLSGVVAAAGLVEMIFVSRAIFSPVERYRLLPEILIGVAAAIAIAALPRARRWAAVPIAAIMVLAWVGVGISLLGASHGPYPSSSPKIPGQRVVAAVAPPVLSAVGIPRQPWKEVDTKVVTLDDRSHVSMNLDSELAADGSAANFKLGLTLPGTPPLDQLGVELTQEMRGLGQSLAGTCEASRPSAGLFARGRPILKRVAGAPVLWCQLQSRNRWFATSKPGDEMVFTLFKRGVGA